MFSKDIAFLIMFIAAAPVFSLCLKDFVSAPVSSKPLSPDKAQSVPIDQLAHSVVFGQPLPQPTPSKWLCWWVCLSSYLGYNMHIWGIVMPHGDFWHHHFATL